MIENILGLITASALAGLVGLEREMRLQKSGVQAFGGFRTFAMIGAFGYLSMILEKSFGFKGFSLVSFSGIFLLLAISHAANVFQGAKIGLTSKLSALVSFLIGILIAHNQLVFAIAVSLLFTLILAFKGFLHKMAKNFSEEEFLAILKFLIVSGVILPLLPDKYIDPWGIFNPKIIWLMVVLVASIRFIGFILAKIFGNRQGIVLSGAIGGLLSSTATTNSLAEQSKKDLNNTSPFVAGILFANAIMFVRVFFEAQVVHPELSKELVLPLFSMCLLAVAFGFIAYLKRSKIITPKKSVSHSQPFSLPEALKFGAFYILILAAVKIVPSFLGDNGLYATALISGLADTDAITLSVADLVRTGSLSFDVGTNAILIAVMTNTAVKIVIVGLFGSRQLTKFIAITLGLVIVGGGLALFI